MGTITILGTSAAVADIQHDHAHFVLQAGGRMVLVDCGGNPLVNLQKAGLNPLGLTDIILTHFHPDHVSGFSLLLMEMWLLGRKAPIQVYGLGYTLERARAMMDLYDWRNWPGFFNIEYHDLPAEAGSNVLADADLRITAAPVQHLIPNIGLRMEFVREKKVAAYSSDTEPCPAVIQLARQADVLLHEASGGAIGHSSAGQAGEIASQAQAGALYLIHYPAQRRPEDLLYEAGLTFAGTVTLTTDQMKVEFS